MVFECFRFVTQSQFTHTIFNIDKLELDHNNGNHFRTALSLTVAGVPVVAYPININILSRAGHRSQVTGHRSVFYQLQKQPQPFTNRRVHALDCIMGNQGHMAENSKFCMEIQSKIYST